MPTWFQTSTNGSMTPSQPSTARCGRVVRWRPNAGLDFSAAPADIRTVTHLIPGRASRPHKLARGGRSLSRDNLADARRDDGHGVVQRPRNLPQSLPNAAAWDPTTPHRLGRSHEGHGLYAAGRRSRRRLNEGSYVSHCWCCTSLTSLVSDGAYHRGVDDDLEHQLGIAHFALINGVCEIPKELSDGLAFGLVGQASH